MVRTHAFTARGTSLIPGQGTNIPQTAWCGREKKKRNPEDQKSGMVEKLTFSLYNILYCLPFLLSAGVTFSKNTHSQTWKSRPCRDDLPSARGLDFGGCSDFSTWDGHEPLGTRERSVAVKIMAPKDAHP